MVQLATRIPRPAVLVYILILATSALAGDCSWWWPCGEVDNKSDHQMSYTLTIDSGDHKCAIWNYNDGKPVSCTQEKLDNGHRGGGDVDVDAFCYASVDYKIRYGNEGEWSTIKKGVWTKINDLQTANCAGGSDEPGCTIG